MTAHQCLALVLAWGRSAGPTSFLGLVFGTTASVVSLFLRFGRRLLVKLLSTDINAQVRLPDHVDIEGLQDSISSKYPLLGSVHAVMDGLKLRLQASGRSEIQNMFYNGWTHDHYVSNVFVFSPQGLIIARTLNAPGCMHDSQIAEWGSVYAKLEEVFRATGGQVVVDSAFSETTYGFLLKSGQDVVLPTAIGKQRKEVIGSVSCTRLCSYSTCAPDCPLFLFAWLECCAHDGHHHLHQLLVTTVGLLAAGAFFLVDLLLLTTLFIPTAAFFVPSALLLHTASTLVRLTLE
ncbi:hypothetical protein PF005_g24802 [Phytophthora fragariae]|uniref:DDE Tnp4 domain-containing protein n=1 Tax=Phytophthora fragariae TaxID=53985 RepID=A0A6A3QH59_9STRA|nr:hypothetical protein PF007_g24851 [Phytophthora fragariae]KAE9176708.1 hypothetical protein PF005_g24802 [Phytophthora fragariae]KAE9187165.1 hypothetical protein PF002_g25667 [Phytophthora fragariae]